MWCSFFGIDKLQGDADVVCGGPPCQGISGYNRFRNVESPLDDERNRQIIVFMDIIDFLRPKYILMENVADILRFAKGCLGRYALSRLVHMNYQARLGIMAAGCYGVPQFRLRVFLWGAQPQEASTHSFFPFFCGLNRQVLFYYEIMSRVSNGVSNWCFTVTWVDYVMVIDCVVYVNYWVTNVVRTHQLAPHLVSNVCIFMTGSSQQQFEDSNKCKSNLRRQVSSFIFLKSFMQIRNKDGQNR